MQCPICQVDYPMEHFVVYNAPKGMCRKCRAREVARKCMRRKRGIEQVLAGYEKRISRRVTSEATTLRLMRGRVLKSRFLKVTAVTRTRIKQLQGKIHPRSVTALKVRERLLARYEHAYKEQVELLNAGFMPDDIMEYVLPA